MLELNYKINVLNITRIFMQVSKINWKVKNKLFLIKFLNIYLL